VGGLLDSQPGGKWPGREASPSAAVVDSQSAEAKIVGRKRHMVDTGRLLVINLTPAVPARKELSTQFGSACGGPSAYSPTPHTNRFLSVCPRD
jgi:hypothetical protein